VTTAPSTTRLAPHPSASIVAHTATVQLFPIQPVRWIHLARPVFRWLEHPIRMSGGIVKFAAIWAAFLFVLWNLLVLVML
jgi:hypothetical protein